MGKPTGTGFAFNNVKDNGAKIRVREFKNVPASSTNDHTLCAQQDPKYRSKFSLERNLLFLGVNIRGFHQFKQGCTKLAMSLLQPHVFALVEVGKYSPAMPGYQLTKSTLRNFGGALLYIRGDMLILKTDSLGDTVITLFQPNREAIVCAVATYVSPNDKAYTNTIARIEDYLAMIAQAYQNLSIIIFGDFNHRADSAFTGYTRNFPSWTCQGRSRTVTDMFLTRTTFHSGIAPTLEDYSDNSTFANSDHRLMGLRTRIPVNSMRIKVLIPKVTERLKEMENILAHSREPDVFFKNLRVLEPKIEYFKAPIPPFKFAQEIRLAMLARDPSLFVSKNKQEWDNAIAKMFTFRDRKMFFKTLKKLTKYNASKGALFTSSIIVDGIVETDPAKVADVVIREVLLHEAGAPLLPIPLPLLEQGELYCAASQLSVGKGMGPDWIPDSFFSRFIDQSNDEAKKELLTKLGKNPLIMAEHFVSRLVLINKNKVGIPTRKEGY